MNIYSFYVQPWLRVDFVLFLRVKENKIIFTDDVIKDKPLFISTILGTNVVETTRRLDLWEFATPYLDWEKVKREAVSYLNFMPECIQCNVRTCFCFDRYPEYDWLKKMAETIELKGSSDD